MRSGVERGLGRTNISETPCSFCFEEGASESPLGGLWGDWERLVGMTAAGASTLYESRNGFVDLRRSSLTEGL